jgi:hypothetical protein
MKRGRLGWLIVASGAALVAPSSHAAAEEAEADCFDALVYASIARQTPTIQPDCGDDCIVMRWPWIVELDVERAIKGKVPSSRLTVLTVQHSDYRADLGMRRWWLRRNDLGGFNALSFDERVRYPRCPEGTPPAAPFVRPGNGRTIRDLQREGDRHYGKAPD